MIRQLAGIYVILDGETMPDIPGILAASLLAGVRVFQYREKRGCDITLLRALYEQTQTVGAILLVNDEPDLAQLVDGLHVGQDDLQSTSIADLRMRFPDKIIGVSAHTAGQANAAYGADYIGVGPLHVTLTKAVNREALGYDGIASIVRASLLPVCAIGGIAERDIAPLRAAGAAMAAVIGSLAKAAQPFSAALSLVEAWNSAPFCVR